MGRRVLFHPLARGDLFGLYDYIERESGADRAGAFLNRIEQLCANLVEFPTRSVPRDDLVPGLRTVAMERRVLIALTVDSGSVTILRVLYAGRELTPEIVPQ